MIDRIEKFSVLLKRLDRNMLEQVRQWRNDPQVSKHMFTQDIISPEQQLAWFKALEPDPSRAYFVIHFKDEAIGVANLTAANGVDLAAADLIYSGFYLGPNRYRGTVIAFFPALALNDYCFNELSCKQLAAQVKSENRAAIRFNQSLGYEIAEEKDGAVLMLLNRIGYLNALDNLKRFIR